MNDTLPAVDRMLDRSGYNPFYVKLAYFSVALFIIFAIGLFIKGLFEHRDVLASACEAFGAKPIQNQRFSETVEEYALLSQNGEQVTLSQAMGTALKTHPNVMIHFWATWCKPCLTELPSLIRLIQEKGQAVLAISVDNDPETAKAFAKKYKLNALPLFFDPGGKLAKSLGTTKFPESYLATQSNALDYHIVNQRNWIDATATACLSTIR